MIDAGAIAAGIIAGVGSQKAVDLFDHVTKSGLSHEEKVEILLAGILEGVSPQEKTNQDISLLLQPAPYEYFIDENWMGKSHFCIFFPAVTQVTLFTEGAGTVTKASVAGWMQVDLRGRLSSGDANNHPVILSYRDDALGVAF